MRKVTGEHCNNSGKTDGDLTRLIAMKVGHCDPIPLYFEGSVSLGLGIGSERERSQG